MSWRGLPKDANGRTIDWHGKPEVFNANKRQLLDEAAASRQARGNLLSRLFGRRASNLQPGQAQ